MSSLTQVLRSVSRSSRASDGRLGKGGGRGLQASGVVQIHPQGQEQWWQEPSFGRAGGVNPVSGGQGTFGAIGRRMLVFFFFA